MMKLIILAGGGGIRLFPLSRSCMPKQFLKLDQKKSLLAQTVERFQKLVSSQNMVVVTNEEYIYQVKTELAEVGAQAAHILLEPVARNTAPAIALAVRYCLDELKCDDSEVLFVTPSDHLIGKKDLFHSAVKQAESVARERGLVIFGVYPSSPETGYGYIKAGEQLSANVYSVKAFKEKPDLATAKQYISQGDYYWNSGMFAFTCDYMLKEFQFHSPKISKLAELPFSELLARFSQMPDISLDYAVTEKSAYVAMIPLKAEWNDIGSWDAIYDVLPKDEAGNAISGDCLTIGCKNNLMMGKSRLVAGIGLEDLLVVETDDVILVAKQGESQKVKDLVGEINKRGRKEASEATTIYRPWGSYTVLGEGPSYKMKKIIVKPGHTLSLQLHYYRSEHWIVIRGTARVTIGEAVQTIHENSSIFVPQSTKHRLENSGEIPLEIIEVQNGSYLGEDDIVRY